MGSGTAMYVLPVADLFRSPRPDRSRPLGPATSDAYTPARSRCCGLTLCADAPLLRGTSPPSPRRASEFCHDQTSRRHLHPPLRSGSPLNGAVASCSLNRLGEARLNPSLEGEGCPRQLKGSAETSSAPYTKPGSSCPVRKRSSNWQTPAEAYIPLPTPSHPTQIRLPT